MRATLSNLVLCQISFSRYQDDPPWETPKNIRKNLFDGVLVVLSFFLVGFDLCGRDPVNAVPQVLSYQQEVESFSGQNYVVRQFVGVGFFSRTVGQQVVPSATPYVSQFPISQLSVPLEDLFESPSDEVLLGIRSDHFYLVAQGTRGESLQVMAPFAVELDDPAVDKGLIVRFRNVSSEAKRRLQEQIKRHRGRHHVSCVSAVYSILRESGIQLAGPEGEKEHYRAAPFFRKVLELGFVDVQGEPIEIEIYNLGGRSLERMYQSLWQTDAFHTRGVVYIGKTWDGVKSVVQSALSGCARLVARYWD